MGRKCKKYNYTIFTALLIIGLQTGTANTYEFQQLSVEQGLPGDNVRAVYQDSYGYLWFGIESAGLCKYDGNRFHVYGTNSNDSNSLSNSFINAILEDQNGNLWIATENGLNIYHRDTEIFTKFRYPEIPGNTVYTLYKDQHQDIWIGTSAGTIKFDVEKKENSYEYHINKNLKIREFERFTISSILQDTPDQYWFGTHNGLYKINFHTSTSYQIEKYPIEEADINANQINDFIKLHDNYYLIGSDYGIHLLNEKTKKINTLSFEKSGIFQDARVGIMTMYIDKRNLLWIGTNSNGVITGPASNIPKDLPFEINTPTELKGITSAHIRDIFEDNTGQLWIITKFAGVFRYDRRSQLFPFYTLDDTNNNFIISAFESKTGDILLGTKFGGFFNFNPETKSFKQNKIYIDNVFARRIESMYQDQDGKIWLGIKKGVVKLDENKNVEVIYRAPKVWCFLNDSDNKVFWIGTENGIYHLNKKSQRVEPYPHKYRHPFFRNNTVSVPNITKDSEGRIWFGTDALGIFVLDPVTEQLTDINQELHQISGSTNLTVRSIIEDSKKNIWIGTKSRGLFKYNINSNTVAHFSKNDGLPSNTIFSITEDERGNMWLTTNYGVSQYLTKENKFINFNKSHGLQGNVFESRATVKLRNGNILFGGNKGFNIFDPEYVEIDTFSPPLVLSEITVNGEALLKNLFSENKIIIPFNNARLVSFEFASLDFRDPGSVQYTYQLDGADKTWIYSGQRNIVTYTALPHGNYTFKFRATNANGIWTNKHFTQTIIIERPFWLKWYSISFYILFIIALFFAIFKFATIRANYAHQLQTKELEIQRNEDLNQMKLRFFTNISHELRTPLSLILAPLQKLLKSDELSTSTKQKIELVEKSTNRLIKLTDQLLYFRKAQQANLKLELSHSNIVGFVKDIIDPFFELAEKYQLYLTYSSNYSEYFVWFDPDKIEKIISNLVSNAFKYTPRHGQIEVKISKPDKTPKSIKNTLFDNIFEKGQYIIISVKDTGIGMTEKQQAHIFERFYQAEPFDTGVGIGLELVKQLIDIHKAKIEVESLPGQGTCFSVLLPYAKSIYKKEEFSDKVINNKDYISNVGPLVLFGKEQIKDDPDDLPMENKPSKNKPTLLIVEDNAELKHFLEDSFVDDFKVLLAQNGKEGLDITTSTYPDLIISDIMMPEMDGIEFSRRVKSNMQTSHIPIILLTAKNLYEEHIEGLETGVDDYITKPFNIEILKTKIKNITFTRKKLVERLSNSIYIEPSEVATNKLDEQFLEKLIKLIDANLEKTDMSINELSKQLNMDRTNLFKKIKTLTGKSPSQFVREYKIKLSAQLLLKNNHNINEVSYMVGFSSPAYFSKLFKEVIGKTPSEFAGTRNN